MENPDLASLEAALTDARADVARIRAENAGLADVFREDPSDGNREIMKRGAASLSAARDREAEARAAVAIMKKTGSRYGLLAEEGRVAGSLAVTMPPGISREAREKIIEDALTDKLTDAAESSRGAPSGSTNVTPWRSKSRSICSKRCARISRSVSA